MLTLLDSIEINACTCSEGYNSHFECVYACVCGLWVCGGCGGVQSNSAENMRQSVKMKVLAYYKPKT